MNIDRLKFERTLQASKTSRMRMTCSLQGESCWLRISFVFCRVRLHCWAVPSQGRSSACCTALPHHRARSITEHVVFLFARLHVNFSQWKFPPSQNIDTMKRTILGEISIVRSWGIKMFFEVSKSTIAILTISLMIEKIDNLRTHYQRNYDI